MSSAPKFPATRPLSDADATAAVRAGAEHAHATATSGPTPGTDPNTAKSVAKFSDPLRNAPVPRRSA
jgi:hypothetical protein